MTWLITSDLHLSDRAKDWYRFDLFKWLAKQQQQHGVTATFLLGDFTEQKDRHSAILVNQTVDGMALLKPPIYCLKGNHDFIDPANPYFRFLNRIEGLEFVLEPQLLGSGAAMIPHQPDQQAFDKACSIIPPKTRAVMCHQTFQGAIAETGARLAGLQTARLAALKPLGCYAGDIHKPQQCGPVAYVGAPYHVRFGDNYQPRVLLVKNGKEQNLYFPAPHKWSLKIKSDHDILNNEDLVAGDQAKITVELAREELVEWAAYKQRVLAACKQVGLEVYGLDLKVLERKRERVRIGEAPVKTAKDVVTAFCTSEHVASNIKKIGMELLEDV